MKTITALVFGLLLIPSVSFAAQLTTLQANSLISVVQSSPTTPASAFTNLITAFSNITVPQAESLITVVQAAPAVPASAFVNMLVAFTVDPTPILGTTQTPQPTQPTQTTQPVQNIPLTTTPVVQSVVMDKSGIIIKEVEKRQPDGSLQPYGSYVFSVAVQDVEGNAIKFAPITMKAPNHKGQTEFRANGVKDNDDTYWTAGIVYVPTSNGEKTLTFTSGNLTKDYTLTVD